MDGRKKVVKEAFVLFGAMVVIALLVIGIAVSVFLPRVDSETGESPDRLSGDSPGRVQLFEVHTAEGRWVPCIWAAEGNRGGLSCDWSAER